MKIGITGITGRMGQAIAKLVWQDSVVELASGLVRKGHEFDGRDLTEFLGLEKSGLRMVSSLEEFIKNCDAVIDFSSPVLSLEIAKRCAEARKILVCGTTGLSDEEKQEFASNAQKTVIIWSANMSVGINLLMNLAEKVAGLLHDDYDVEIFEMHHKNKSDSPSGTALSLGAAVSKGRGVDLKKVGQMARVGKDSKRHKGQIGFCSLRGGDVIGDHSVIFATEGERLELTHKASSREIFARGAIRAAIWGSGRKAGFYTMRDVLKEF